MLVLHLFQESKLCMRSAGINRVKPESRYDEYLQQSIKLCAKIYLIFSLLIINMSSPFISICIPAYKRPEQMKRLLGALSQQTFTDYEVIITDDTPDNEVKEVVNSFPGLPLRYFKNQPAAGMPGNWNLVMQKASAPWIQLMHADDWYASPGSLAAFAAVCKKTSHSFVFCASREVNKEGRILKTLQLNTSRFDLLKGDPFHLVYDNVIGHPSVVLHKKDSSIHYNPSFKWVVDIDYYLRYLNQHPGFDYISEPLINIGTDEEQVSFSAYKNPDIEIPEYLQMISYLPEEVQRSSRYVFYSIWNLVRKFRIKDTAYIAAHGYTGKLPEALQFIIQYQRKIPRFILKQTDWSFMLMKRCYKKWRRTVAKKK